MKYVEVGGVKISSIGLGTWQFGSSEWGYGSDYSEREAGEIVRRALELGVNMIDTAEIYGFGRSERIVGEALRGRRQSAFLATKILPVLPIRPVVVQRLRGSLRRLGVESVDLYQLHQPNPVVPLSATMPAFAELMDQGLTRNAGVSNYSLARWQRAEEALSRPVLSNQVKYNLVDRRPEAELLPWAQANGRLVIAYSPIAQGFLSGRYDENNPPPGKVRANSTLFLPENLSRAKALVEVLRDIASAHDATPSQIALAWLVRRPNVVAIPGASSVGQMEANAAAAEIEITGEEDAALVSAAEAFHPLSGPPAVLEVARRRVASLRKAA